MATWRRLSILAGGLLLCPNAFWGQNVVFAQTLPDVAPSQPSIAKPVVAKPVVANTVVVGPIKPVAKPAPAPIPPHSPKVQRVTHKVPVQTPAPVVSPPPAPEVVKPETDPTAPKVGSVTGRPLPRFAALRSDDVNLRVGPGTRYPIGWVYKRRDLPVEIEREFEVWRLVSDEEGNRGWVHEATLTGRRTFVVRDATRTLRHSPEAGAAPVAILKPGVVGRIISCAASATWCEVQVSEYRGYLRREEFWGILPGEAVNP